MSAENIGESSSGTSSSAKADSLPYASSGTPSANRSPDQNPPWLRYVAMLTGALAAVAGYLTVRSTVLSNEAIFQSTQAVLHQAQASDNWAEYQADSIKAHIAQTAALTAADPDAKAKLLADMTEFRNDQPPVKAKAEEQENLRQASLTSSDVIRGERNIIQYAGMAIQLGIALASVAALTRKYSLFVIGAFCGVTGVGITAYSLFVHYFVHG